MWAFQFSSAKRSTFALIKFFRLFSLMKTRRTDSLKSAWDLNWLNSTMRNEIIRESNAPNWFISNFGRKKILEIFGYLIYFELQQRRLTKQEWNKVFHYLNFVPLLFYCVNAFGQTKEKFFWAFRLFACEIQLYFIPHRMFTKFCWNMIWAYKNSNQSNHSS